MESIYQCKAQRDGAPMIMLRVRASSSSEARVTAKAYGYACHGWPTRVRPLRDSASSSD